MGGNEATPHVDEWISNNHTHSGLTAYEFTAPVGWVGIENGLRERPRMSPWVEERALPFAIGVIGASKECVDPVTRSVTECAAARCVEGASLAWTPALATTMAPLLCKS